MIFGFSSEADNRKNADMAEAAGVTLMRSYDISSVNTATATLAGDVLYCAQQGVKMILQYNEETVANGGLGPDMALGNLVAHISSVGPNGTLWNGANESLRHLAPTHIEVGNEWSYSYRGDQVTPAIGIANTVQRFYNAVGGATAHGMKFICEGEDAGSGSDQFMNKLLQTVPTIRTMLDGWTVHGYGPPGGNESPHAGSPGTQYGNITRLNDRLVAKGFTGDKIWITENGISTDNGVSLTNNYGWAVNKTYSQAGTSWLAHVRLIGSGLSFSSRIYCLLQFQGFDQFPSGTNNDRERYFGAYQNNGSAKGAFTTASITLADEYPAVAAPPTTTPTPGGAVAGGNAPSDGGTTEVVQFVSQVGTSIFPATDPWVVQGAGSGQSGDFVVIGLVQAQQAPTVTPPAGFTTDGTATEGTDGRLRVYYAYYSTVGAGPYSFDISGTQAGYAVCAYYRGVRTTTPLDATSLYNATGSATAWAGGSITPANAGAMIVTIAGCSPNAVGRTTTVTAPAIKRGGAENGASSLYVLGDKLLTTPAATTIAGTISIAESMAIGTLALRAAPVAPPTGVFETPGRGDATAVGRTPAPRGASPPGGCEGQGIGTASAIYTSLVTYPSATTYPSPFVGLKFRTLITPGGANSGGFAPSPTGTPVTATPTPGGAVAGGFAVTARVAAARGAATADGASPGDIQAAIPGGATAEGRAPTTRTTFAAGAATAAGTSPSPKNTAAPVPGAATAAGSAPQASSALTPGGATAAGASQSATVTETPTPGRAMAGGFADALTYPGADTYPGGVTYPGSTGVVAELAARTLVPPGAFTADGFSAPVGPTVHAPVAQGAAVAGGTAPGQGEIPTPGDAIATGTTPTARAEVVAGEAIAGGFTFSEPPLPPLAVAGGADAAGTEPLVCTALTPGGADADGVAPTSQTTATPEPGGADTGANEPVAQVAPDAGASSADGSAPGANVSLPPGDATAAGVPQTASETSVTPTPGGAEADGTGPSAWTTIEIDGAIAATNQITGATVLITPGGSLAGGRVPLAPVIIARHFDDDDPPVLAGAFDAGTQRGQT